MSELLVFAGIAFLTCVTPGAGVLYTVTSALRLGRGAFTAAPLGNFCGVVFMSVVSAAGLGAVVAASPALYGALQAVCALVLAWMGWQNWKRPAVDLASAHSLKSAVKEYGTGLTAFAGAFVLQITNPMLLVFLFSIMPPFVHPENDYVSRMALLIAVFSLICLAVHLVYGFVAAFASQYLKGKKFSWWINHVSAVVFWFLAAGVIAMVFEGAPA